MNLRWIRETPACWDADKARIIGGAPAGIFGPSPALGDAAPGEWWRVEQSGRVVGYGWMDIVWGEGEILLAVAPEAWGQGVGTFALNKLEQEAAACGLNYIYNTVRASHPNRKQATAWFQARGFRHVHGDERLVRRVWRRAAA